MATIADGDKDTPTNITELADQINRFQQSELYRAKKLLMDRDPDDEVTRLMRKFPALKKQIDNGSLKFQLKVPGYNGNKLYFGFTKQLN